MDVIGRMLTQSLGGALGFLTVSTQSGATLRRIGKRGGTGSGLKAKAPSFAAGMRYLVTS
jgi:hypothetical protein